MSEVEGAKKLIIDLLTDKSDEIKRNAAVEMWLRYDNMSYKDRRRGLYR